MSNASYMLVFGNDGLGKAETGLRQLLALNYLNTIAESAILPKVICFYADGAKLVIEGSPVIEPLKKLESLGVKIIACRTCLLHFGSVDKVNVGMIGTMTDIVDMQLQAEKVITL
jgi:hypothetical protein